MIALLVPVEQPCCCDECGSMDDDVIVLAVLRSGEEATGGLALCQLCQTRLEALLRGNRKSSPSAGQWRKT